MKPTANRPVLLCILDGWGDREDPENNAIVQADTPVWDRLTATCTTIEQRGRTAIHDVVVHRHDGEAVAVLRGRTLTVGGMVSNDDNDTKDPSYDIDEDPCQYNAAVQRQWHGNCRRCRGAR